MGIEPLYIGIVAGIFTAVSMVPQLVKIIRHKQAEQISIMMIVVLLAGNAAWVYYGVVQEDYPVIITNCFSLVLNIFLVILSVKYKQQG